MQSRPSGAVFPRVSGARALTAASRWASVGRVNGRGQSETDRSGHPRHRRGCTDLRTRVLCAVSVRHAAKHRAISTVASAAGARPHAHPSGPRLSLPDVSHHLSGAVHLRISGAWPRAPMHLLARSGKSPERAGYRAEDALLVGAGSRPRALTRAQFHSRTSTKCPAIAAAAAIAGDTRWVRPL